MQERIEWDDRAAHHLRTRALRYADAIDIEPAAMVITVVALRDGNGVLHGGSAWRTTGRARRQYREGRADD